MRAVFALLLLLAAPTAAALPIDDPDVACDPTEPSRSPAVDDAWNAACGAREIADDQRGIVGSTVDAAHAGIDCTPSEPAGNPIVEDTWRAQCGARAIAADQLRTLRGFVNTSVDAVVCVVADAEHALVCTPPTNDPQGWAAGAIEGMASILGSLNRTGQAFVVFAQAAYAGNVTPVVESAGGAYDDTHGEHVTPIACGSDFIFLCTLEGDTREFVAATFWFANALGAAAIGESGETLQAVADDGSVLLVAVAQSAREA